METGINTRFLPRDFRPFLLLCYSAYRAGVDGSVNFAIIISLIFFKRGSEKLGMSGSYGNFFQLTIGAIIVAVISLSCATPYQSRGFMGGYSDTKVADDMYRVSFKGNGFTSDDTVQNYFLRRCADITLRDGFDHFQILQSQSSSEQQVTGSHSNGTLGDDGFGQFNYSGSTSYITVTRHKMSGLLKMFKEGRQPASTLNARTIQASIPVEEEE